MNEANYNKIIAKAKSRGRAANVLALAEAAEEAAEDAKIHTVHEVEWHDPVDSSLSVDKTTSEDIECYSTASLLRAKKHAKTETVSTICIAIMNLRKGKEKASHMQELQVLLDSGCSGTMINKQFMTKHKVKTSSKQSWTTKSGTFQTAGKAKVVFTLPEFHEHREIEWTVHVDQSDHEDSTYDMIMGRDCLDTLGMDLMFSEHIFNMCRSKRLRRTP